MLSLVFHFLSSTEALDESFLCYIMNKRKRQPDSQMNKLNFDICTFSSDSIVSFGISVKKWTAVRYSSSLNNKDLYAQSLHTVNFFPVTKTII